MSDFAAKLDEARRNLPLRRLMEQYGKGAPDGKWGSSFKCPWCGGNAGVFKPKNGDAPELFKCQHVPCPTDNQAFEEIGFIAFHLNLSREEAWKTYFKEAGVWKDQEAYPPSILPGASKRHFQMSEGGEDEGLVLECIEVIRREQKASVTLLQRRLRLGYTRAARIMAELERRGIVGPAKGAEPREVLKLPEKTATSPRPSPQGGEGEERNNLPPAQSTAQTSAPTEPSPGLGADAPLESKSGAGAAVVPGTPSDAVSANASPGGDHPGPIPGEAPISGDGHLTPPLSPQGGEGEKAGGGAPAPPAGDPPPPALAALRWFYERLTLVESDLDRLWDERAFRTEFSQAMGYRSNLKANKELLLAMEKEFPVNVLLDSGLWNQGDKPTDPPKPNPQFYGMSLVEKRDEHGKKVRDRDGDVIVDCVWGDPGPILIPYFDERGELVHLRPHKGMMRGKTPRFYICRKHSTFNSDKSRAGIQHPTSNGNRAKYAVLTEGEFKAGSILQALGEEAAVGALPGITMAKPLFGDIEEWLESLEVRQVVMGYDNEDKSNPELPGYQEDAWRRFDAQIWARYLARQLAKEGYEAKVCVLPNEWRNAAGKADWDGRAATLLDQEFERLSAEKKRTPHPGPLPAGRGEGEKGPTGAELWAAALPKIRAEFLAVIKGALPVRELWQSGMFDSEEERIIKNGLERISFERALPIGGDDETTTARRLQRLVARLKRSGDSTLPAPARGFLMMLAKNYLDLNGGYYIFKKLSDKQFERWQIFADKANNLADTDMKRACEIVLKGVPQRVSDFFMKAHYVLVKLNGTRVRLVTLHNIHGAKTGLITLPSTPFSQPSKFREWLLDSISGATWSAGERELNALQSDIARDVSFKEVEEVAVRGQHPESKCWFFGDVVYTDDSRELFADKSGIIWLKTKGEINRAFKLGEHDHEGQNFCQKTPRMHPNIKATDAEVAALFDEMAYAMLDTLGGCAGYLAMGAVLAYGAGPEIYTAFNGFPGLWVHGEQGQGKSSVVRWLMRIWGFAIDKGMPLADSTKVGISIAMQQYGNVPVWLEEFQPDAARWMVEKIKNLFNRESGIKKTFDEGTRQILTNAIITGVATCSDAQTKSRYAHVQVSAKNRIKNHYDWFQDNMKRFFLIGRYILLHRKDFAVRTVKHMEEWLRSKDMVGVDERARIVHGACYGAFAALVEMLSPETFKDELLKYQQFLFKHCAEAAGAVRDQVNVNQFWRDLLDACKSNAFGDTLGERQRIFKMVEFMPEQSPVSEYQTKLGAESEAYRFPSYLLYFLPGPVIEMLRRYKRLNGRELPLDRADLRSQMRVRKYWVESKNPRGHSQRFAGSKVAESCWCINLNEHEFGLQVVSDEEFEASLYRDGDTKGDYIPRIEWTDPRKGDLFALVESLKSRKDDNEPEE